MEVENAELKPIAPPDDAYIPATHSDPTPMRQPDFECSQEYTKDVVRDFMQIKYKRILGTSLIYAVYFIFILALCVFSRSAISLTIIILETVMLALIVAFLITTKITEKKQYDKMLYTNGGKPIGINTYFFDDEFVITKERPEDTVNLNYSDVKSLTKSGALFLLELKYKLYAYVPQDIKGKNALSFPDYIFSKDTSIKKKKIKDAGLYRALTFCVICFCAAVLAASVVVYLNK